MLFSFCGVTHENRMGQPALLTSRQERNDVFKGYLTSISSTVAILSAATIIMEVLSGGSVSKELILIFAISMVIAMVGWVRLLLKNEFV